MSFIPTQRSDLLEMADSTHRCHGNFPQRRETLLPPGIMCREPLALETMSSETDPNRAIAPEEPTPPAEYLSSSGFREMEKEAKRSCNGKTRAASPTSEKFQRHPDKNVNTLLKRLRIHPEAQRVLGNSCIPVVTLERLKFQSMSLSSLQPVVSLIRLPCQTQAELHSDVSLDSHEQQNGFSPSEVDTLEVREEPEWADQTETTSWTEPYCPDSPSFEEPEQDSGFDCKSNPDQPYILCDSGSDDGKNDSETFYLDPDPEQTLVIELDLEAEAEPDLCLQLEDESETNCEADGVHMNHGEDQTPDLCCSLEQQPEAVVLTEEMESEDFCAVCLNGGELLCCDRCPKVYHLACHIPPLISFPLGDWVCTLCRTDQEPVEDYDCEKMHPCGAVKVPYTLSNQDQRRCEKLALLLYCHAVSAPFHEPVSPLARNYYQIIKRPIDLSVIRRKLDKSNTLHYFTAEQFVDDVLLMFKNCASFNYPDSEVASAGRNLELFFLSKLKEIFPDRMFPSVCQDTTERARLRWLSRKRKENYKKRRYVFSGKKYYL
ncbi:transcription intermediary factor 1-alpha-like isoform X2 [Melanotaenia boesemani]|uniref:transcription intermediary factor 1-alpha-like isoform X2 n=1 Tax=Melanotaenia boesemani TaxID=1250792 RepID=UPI001C04ABE5|nr:transcription intermediary factor 1-alpha-like isoform X2 [Melanotaenia boesemani]XP_041853661.1 transcription intermediary factor 1-alpha-like isoform X2 [Melanotaenia boesemani]